MSKNRILPAVHLSIDELANVEKLLRENTTNCETEVVLSLPGGVKQKFHSVGQIDSRLLADVGGSNSYSLSAAGEEGRCTIAGESTDTESHMLYCEGDSDWINEIQHRVKEHLDSVESTKSRLRGRLTGIWATGVAVSAALFVGWAMTAVTPQPMNHYYPSLWDAIVFSLGTFGLFIVRFRNWVHPYIWIGPHRSYPTKFRFAILGIAAILVTISVLAVRSWMEAGPFLR